MQIIEKIKNYILLFFHSTLNSYSSIYFSEHKLFAFILIGVTFFSPYAGLSGLIAVVSANLLAYLMGYNEYTIRRGYYGFNSLLVGLGLGVTFSPGLAFYILLLFAAILTLFLTIAMEGVIGKYALPYLSVPFLFSTWLVSVATQQYSELVISQNGVYVLNEIYAMGGDQLLNQYHQLNDLGIPASIEIYLKSLGAIFFQYNIIAGILVAVGLLIYSRISFSLSLIGFFTAYFFYQFIGGNINELSYNYIGFNFILTGIALGGFFIVPSKSSYLWVMVLTPLIAIITSGSTVILWTFQLSIYSLPFNVIVLMFLYILRFRVKQTLRVEEVTVQQYSPEKNFYSQRNFKKRFSNSFHFPLTLPFWGKWTVSQGHEGKSTHKGEWAHAWDFVICDENKKTYQDHGIQKKDFFAFEKPVVAPADGTIEEVVNNIDDNEIGDANVNKNWGNTVIIKHAPYLYSKISHLKKDSIKFKKEDAVKRGDVIAFCGNSGRSPEPHIHFQLQAYPYIDAKTIDFPISYYILHQENSFELKQFEKPKEGDVISGIGKNILITQAYKFVPGKKFSFQVNDDHAEDVFTTDWEVEVDYYNNAYIHCRQTDSKAYFTNDGNIHYFRHFEGDKDSLLFYFYLASYSVMMGFYRKLNLTDQYPLYLLGNKFLMFFQDFLAPFFLFIKADYTLQYDFIDDEMTSNLIRLKSSAEVKTFGIANRRIDFEIEISSDKIQKIIIQEKNRNITALCSD